MERRSKISEIKGTIINDISILANNNIICVGDRVTKTLLEGGVKPRIAVIDLREMRETNTSAIFLLEGFTILVARNPPGKLTREAWSKLAKALELSSKLNVVLLIDGEEDLLGFPAIILSPEGWILAYGQPKIGMVIVRVTEEVRREAIELLHDAFVPV